MHLHDSIFPPRLRPPPAPRGPQPGQGPQPKRSRRHQRLHRARLRRQPNDRCSVTQRTAPPQAPSPQLTAIWPDYIQSGNEPRSEGRGRARRHRHQLRPRPGSGDEPRSEKWRPGQTAPSWVAAPAPSRATPRPQTKRSRRPGQTAPSLVAVSAAARARDQTTPSTEGPLAVNRRIAGRPKPSREAERDVPGRTTPSTEGSLVDRSRRIAGRPKPSCKAEREVLRRPALDSDEMNHRNRLVG